MERIALTLYILFLGLVATVNAEMVSSEEYQQIKQFVDERSNVKIDVLSLNTHAVELFFSVKFYNVTSCWQFNIDGESSSCGGNHTFIKRDNQLAVLEDPVTNQPLTQLTQSVIPGVKIKNQKVAEVFEKALDAIHPISTVFGDEDLRSKAIRQNGNQWIFVRGVFFDKWKGFVVDLNGKDEIVKISYSLAINEQ